MGDLRTAYTRPSENGTRQATYGYRAHLRTGHANTHTETVLDTRGNVLHSSRPPSRAVARRSCSLALTLQQDAHIGERPHDAVVGSVADALRLTRSALWDDGHGQHLLARLLQ